MIIFAFLSYCAGDSFLCVFPSYRFRKSWFFSVFSFSLVSMKWWLPSSFHVELESGQFFVGKYFSLINACKSIPLTLGITRTDLSGPAGRPCSLCRLLFTDSDHFHSLALPHNLQASSALCITWNILSHPWVSPSECTKVPNFQGSKLSFREVTGSSKLPRQQVVIWSPHQVLHKPSCLLSWRGHCRVCAGVLTAASSQQNRPENRASDPTSGKLGWNNQGYF